MAQGRFADAADGFLRLNSEHCERFADLIAPRDIALHGVLTTLATCPREQLNREVVNGSSLKGFLAEEPEARRLLESFYEGRYGECLLLLARNRAAYRLDLFLSAHVDRLIEAIRQRGMIEYFSAYERVKLESMAKAFGTGCRFYRKRCYEIMKLSENLF